VIPVAVEVVVIVVDGKVGYPFFGGTLLLALSTVYPQARVLKGGREGGGTSVEHCSVQVLSQHSSQ
jgi:hypothetical protein